MSESIQAENCEDSYFVENSQLFRDILKSAERALDAKSVRLDFDAESLELTRASGLPTAVEFLKSDPTMPAEEAVQRAEIRQDVALYIAQTTLAALTSVARGYERTAGKQSFYEGSASTDDPAAGKKIAVYHPTTLASGSWRQVESEDANGKVLRITETKLHDTAGAEYASETELTIEDSLVKKVYGITALKGEVKDARSMSAPAEDPLQARILNTLGLENLAIANLLMAGMCTTDEADIDADLNDIWLNCQSSGDEQEVLSLLDEIKTRHLAAKEAAEFSAALGESDQPSFQDLVDLNSYLATL
jgi:hypothetical protein